MWKVMTGNNTTISLNFMITGHTKFAVDRGSGLLKRKFSRTKVNYLADLVKVVEDSSIVNEAVLVGNKARNSFVPVHDWRAFLNPHFMKFPQILEHHNFYPDAARPGVISANKFYNSNPQDVKILKGTLPAGLPVPVTPKYLSTSRQN